MCYAYILERHAIDLKLVIGRALAISYHLEGHGVEVMLLWVVCGVLAIASVGTLTCLSSTKATAAEATLELAVVSGSGLEEATATVVVRELARNNG